MKDYLTAEQYEYAKKTGDWESGKVLTHGQALNDNQKIVFEWLKWSVKDQRHSTIDAVFLLKSGEALDSVLLALMELNDPQQAEVLSAFAQWGLEQEEAE
ncbi:TPA: hypothetical protein QFV61_000916 [Enterococcus faecium]|uniref:hypothetical protein n=1 Tax=Enterococcus faecium TaxID=1352 RepID=UPI000FFF1E8F|nr:hypothetical protein [Enterococcus faecium]MDW3610112.1 hypothetical protein [Enterococcus faecium]MDW3619651.1 hypothetical protein [Enterococcus faecium]RXE92601.1 hypothetical protein EG862_04890 [Enterococcus faecium]